MIECVESGPGGRGQAGQALTPFIVYVVSAVVCLSTLSAPDDSSIGSYFINICLLSRLAAPLPLNGVSIISDLNLHSKKRTF